MSRDREPAEPSPGPEPLPVAYSYIRFSDPSQAAGDSLRRQTEKAADWCEDNGVRLDTALTLRDLGRSAFRGKHRENPDRHALAAFLQLVEQGKVPRGSYLVVEALDRLTREDIQPALLLVLGLLQAGVRIVQLIPVAQVYTDRSGPHEVMLMIVELMRGHSESKAKSDRVGAAWTQRRKKARERSGLLTRRLPAWVEERGGRPALIPERAAVVRRVFELAGTGHGLYAIMRLLTDEKVPAFGPSGRWSISYIDLILRDRRALGELQPRGQGGKPEGDPIKDYFPRVVSDEAWERARLGAQERYRRPGRVTADVNIFQGLLKGAKDGASYTVGKETGAGKPYRILRSVAPRLGMGSAYSFPLATFEVAVLTCLKEIDPHEILNGDGGPDETLALAADLAAVETSVAAILADMDAHGESPALFQRLRQKEARKAELVKQLAAARAKAAHPLSESWGETQSLIEALSNAIDPQDARLRLRSALRRIVDSIWLLVVARGRDRLAAVQFWFAGGKRHRDYLILHRPPKANAQVRQEGGWWVTSLDRVTKRGRVDLRRPEDVAAVEIKLKQLDLAELTAGAGPAATRPARGA
jgi:DNA invertase Pin-like site-specific DNA recombinase